MTKTTRKAIRQRKICMLLIIILIIVLSVLGGGYYLLSQKNAASPQNGGQNSDSRNQTDLSQNSDIVEYKGETYKYNDHLSNYLFLGIDTRETVDTYQSQVDAGQADAIFLVSMDRATEKIKVLFIPRDSMTRIEVFNPAGKSLGMTTDHINIQYAYGDGRQKSCELMKTAVSNLLNGLPVQGYCAMNMDGISVITDYVGGVEITVPDNSLEDINPDFKEGSVVFFFNIRNYNLFFTHSPNTSLHFIPCSNILLHCIAYSCNIAYSQRFYNMFFSFLAISNKDSNKTTFFYATFLF